jgi:hypothetical protein
MQGNIAGNVSKLLLPLFVQARNIVLAEVIFEVFDRVVPNEIFADQRGG